MADPAFTPVAMPAASISATVASSELHTPPLTEFVSVADVPGHKSVPPAIVPGFGAAFTFKLLVVLALPQPFVTVYIMCTTPALKAFTFPEASIVAIEGASVLHAPPLSVLVNVSEVPVQATEPPFIVPASGSALTVMSRVAVAVPQLLVTV